MAANPVFPLYYNDIDRSTRDWTDEEFGCYMRLLMHQWAQGEIPKESQRLARIAESITQNKAKVLAKFVETETGMINERLEDIRAERLAYQKTQSENGKKGGRPSKKPKKNPNHKPNHNPKKSLHNEEEKEIEEEEVKEEGSEAKNYIVPQMCEIWYTKFEHYTRDRENDFAGMGKILQFMLKQSGISLYQPDTKVKILDTVEAIANQVNSQPFWINKPITSIANNIQEFYNTIKNPVQKNGKQANSNLKEQVQYEFNKRFGG